MRAKEYAVSLGLATPGRGRMSREAHAAIKDAIENKGMTFDDYFVKGQNKPETPKVSKPVKAEPVVKDSADGDNQYAQAFMRYPLDQMFSGKDASGKTHKVSGRNACMNCGYSLVGHSCNSPRVLIGSTEAISVQPIGE